MTSRASNITLSIESAILGGSVAASLPDGSVVSSYGASGVSKAEDLLINISSLLGLHGVGKSDIDSIVVSAGPGSFTGIRIGIATAKGLANALNAELRMVSLLSSMASRCKEHGKLAAVLPVGRGMFCGQIFDVAETEITSILPPDPIPIDQLNEWFKRNAVTRFTGVSEHFADLIETITQEFIAIDASLAEVILDGSCDSRVFCNELPIFVSKSTSL